MRVSTALARQLLKRGSRKARVINQRLIRALMHESFCLIYAYSRFGLYNSPGTTLHKFDVQECASCKLEKPENYSSSNRQPGLFHFVLVQFLSYFLCSFFFFLLLRCVLTVPVFVLSCCSLTEINLPNSVSRLISFSFFIGFSPEKLVGLPDHNVI